MAPKDFVEQLLALPDPAAQRRRLEQNAARLGGEIADALKEQADHFLRSDVQRSLEVADLLCYISTLTGTPTDTSLYRALGLLAEANARSIGGLGEYQRAVALYNQAADIYQAQGRPAGQANAQVGKVFSLAMLGRYEEALEAGQWASRVLEAHGRLHQLATLTLNLAVVHGRQREDTKALAMFNRARDLYRRLGADGERLLPVVEQNRAIVLRYMGRFEDSIEASQTALEIARRLGQKNQLGRTQQDLAHTYLFLDRYNEALTLLDEARDVFLADGRPSHAIEAELISSYCLLQLRRFNDALAKCRHIRAQFAEFGQRRELAEAVLYEAAAYAGLNQYAHALASLDEARHIFQEEDIHLWVTRTDLETAAVLYHQNRFEESLATAQAAAGVFRSHDLPFQEAQTRLIAARAAAALSRHDQARRLVHSALAVGESKGIPALIYQCHHLLGGVAKAQGDPERALAEYDQAIENLERLRGRLMIEHRTDFVEDKQAVYEDAVDLCLDLAQPLRGLDYAERAKSRTLLDMLTYRVDLSIQARNAEDRPLVEELTRLCVKRDQLYRRWEGAEEFQVRGQPTSNGRRQQIQREVLNLEKQIEELWHRLLVHNADYARDAALWQVRTEPVRPYLPADTLLLEYYIAHGELIAFLVTAEDVQARRLPVDLGQIKHLLQLLGLNLRAVPRSAASQVPNLTANACGLLGKLYAALVAPLADTLADYQRLIIVPHGPLHYLPFHALHDGQGFLVEHHAIAYLPGASFLRYVADAKSTASDSLVLGHSFQGALPHTATEARSVAALLNGQAYLEEAATSARLRQRLENYRILHLAAHGEFRPDNPLFSGLALADGWLTTLDIFNLRLKASLVTLSACQTGQSVVGGGDELLGLMRAFLYAGAASLVLTQWAVEDRSTARLMQNFYRQLALGQPKAAALRQAQLHFIHKTTDGDDAEAGRYGHPYYWAPFFLVGDAGAL